MIKNSMFKILVLLKVVVLRYVSEDSWGWDGANQVVALNIHPVFNLTDYEVSEFATTSCMPTLWAFRALAYRLGIPVPQADWYWYNK